MNLFKYTSPLNARYIASCSVCFSPVSSFNDPFDGLPDTAALMAMPEYQKLVGQWSQVPKKLQTDKKFVKGAAMAKNIIEQQAKAGMIERLLRDVNANFRILCLSRAGPESAGAALMFGHYANCHQGFAYQFDEENAWFRDHMHARNPTRDIGDVKYRAHRATVVGDGRKGLFVKSSRWVYEEEVRLVRYVGAGANGLTGPAKTIAAYPPEMLRSVIVGCMASPATVAAIKAQLSSRAELRHVRLERMVRHPDAFHFVRKAIV